VDGAGAVVAVQRSTRGDWCPPNVRLRRGDDIAAALDSVSHAFGGEVRRAIDEQRSITGTALVAGPDGHRLAHLQLSVEKGGGPHVLSLWADDPIGAGDGDALGRWARGHDRLITLSASVLASLNGDLSLKEAVQGMLPALLEGLDMEAAAVFVVRNERRAELVAAYGRTRKRGFPYLDLDLADAFLASLLATPRLAQLDGNSEVQRALGDVACRDFGSMVLAPAVAAHGVAAVIVASRRASGPLTVEESAFVATAAEALGLRVHNDLLSAQSMQNAAVLQTAYAVSRAISRSLDLDQTFRQIVQNASRMIPGSHCLLFELDRSAGELVTVAASEVGTAGLVGLRLRFQDSGIDLRALGRRRSIAVEDIVWGASVDPELRRKLGMQSAVFLPMFAQGELVGSLVLYSTGRRRRYTRQELEHAEDVVEQAAIAINNARLYRDLAMSQSRIESLLSRIAQIREHERRTLARVVHDDIVQSIVGAVFRLEAFRVSVPSGELAAFDASVELLRGCIRDARRVIWELRPPVLEGLGLADALRILVDRTNGEGPARVGASLGDVPELSQGKTTALYKIAREAIINAQRHGGASHIWLSWRLEPGASGASAWLRVEDDGVGFDAEARGADHYGIAMMEEQAAVVGGSLRIESHRGRGSVVEATIPVEREQ
jgi:signal transduction histidine kinase